MKLVNMSSLGLGLMNAAAAYATSVVFMLILAAALGGMATRDDTGVSWCQRYARLHRPESPKTDVCTLCCSMNITHPSCQGCTCPTPSPSPITFLVGTSEPTFSPTSAPSVSTHVCSPTLGCNVCQECCQGYIAQGNNCDTCVNSMCAGMGAMGDETNVCSFSAALWLVWMTWHGSPLGDIVAVTSSERFVVVVAAACGFLSYPLFAISMLSASTSTQYKQFVTSERSHLALMQLFKFYAFFAMVIIVLALLLYEVGAGPLPVYAPEGTSSQALSWCEDYHDYHYSGQIMGDKAANAAAAAAKAEASKGIAFSDLSTPAPGPASSSSSAAGALPPASGGGGRVCVFGDALFLVWMVAHQRGSGDRAPFGGGASFLVGVAGMLGYLLYPFYGIVLTCVIFPGYQLPLQSLSCEGKITKVVRKGLAEDREETWVWWGPCPCCTSRVTRRPQHMLRSPAAQRHVHASSGGGSSSAMAAAGAEGTGRHLGSNPASASERGGYLGIARGSDSNFHGVSSGGGGGGGGGVGVVSSISSPKRPLPAPLSPEHAAEISLRNSRATAADEHKQHQHQFSALAHDPHHGAMLGMGMASATGPGLLPSMLYSQDSYPIEADMLENSLQHTTAEHGSAYGYGIGRGGEEESDQEE